MYFISRLNKSKTFKTSIFFVLAFAKVASSWTCGNQWYGHFTIQFADITDVA